LVRIAYLDLTHAAVAFGAAFLAGAINSVAGGGTLVSLWLGFIHEASWSGWIFAYDPAFHRYSVGHRLVLSMLEESFARGHREFDFSEGAEDYKLIYATHGRLLGEIGRRLGLVGGFRPDRVPGIVAPGERRGIGPGGLEHRGRG